MTTFALVVAALVGLACNGGAGGQAPANWCAVNADNPHKSSSGAKKGIDQIIGKGWFKCTKSPEEVTLYVALQQKMQSGWVDVATARPRTFAWPRAGRNSDQVPAVLQGCTDGRFRTAAKITGRDDNGRPGASDWAYSREVVNPCKT